eukprot:3608902-Pleurochrysis_carterae.AAC.5
MVRASGPPHHLHISVETSAGMPAPLSPAHGRVSPRKMARPISPLTRRGGEEVLAKLVEELLSRGIDVSVPQPGHTGSSVRLPLQFFDNTDLERNTAEGWLSAALQRHGSKPNAVVLTPNSVGGGEWKLGRVFRYDRKGEQFVAHVKGEDGKLQEESPISLPRLSVMFLAEKIPEFAERFAGALRARDQCEASLLFQFYVRNMPTADVKTLTEGQVQRLLERALAPSPSVLANSAEMSRLIEEVKLEYAQSMNGILLRDGLHKPPLRDKVRAELLLPPPPPPPPEVGTVVIEDNHYHESKESFVAISALVMPQVHSFVSSNRSAGYSEKL